jgi:hypothetical protein
MTDVTKKLAACEASLKRWHTRLTRASNMVTKLEKQRRRLAAEPKVIKEVRSELKPLVKFDDLASLPSNVKKEDDIPDFLNRSNPLIAEQMTAARKKAEAAARSAMPLTGRAAQDFIKSKRKKA